MAPSAMLVSLLASAAVGGRRSTLSSRPARAQSNMVVTSHQVVLPGRALTMEYAVARPSAPPPGRSAPPPLIFVHGTFHGSWCYAEHWLPYFASQGYDAYAVSLRGTGASPEPAPRSIGVDEHVADLSAFLSSVVRAPAVLVGHSFGGAYVQKVLERGDAAVVGAVLLCSVPPSGNTAMIWRFIRRSPMSALRITRGFALKSACSSVDDASRLFFSGGLPEADVRRYMQRFDEDSSCGLNVGDFNKKLPALRGRERAAARCPPVLVVGAELDAVVDAQAIDEAADFYGGERVMLPEIGHDVMLVPGWEKAADVLCEWLSRKVAAGA
jgi:pimeloyl-ACP methyl ester carboxylesterase